MAATLVGAPPQYATNDWAQIANEQVRPGNAGVSEKTQGYEETDPQGELTDDEDLFDWEINDENHGQPSEAKVTRRRKPLRKLVYAITHTPPIVRMSILALFGGIICMIPFIVTYTRFRNKPHFLEAEIWSVWLTIIWVTSVATFLVFGWIPRAALKIAELVFGRVPDLYSDVVSIVDGVLFYIKLVFCTVWAWASLRGTISVVLKLSSQSGEPEYFHTIANIVKSLFATSIIVLAEKITLKLIAQHFHKSTLRDRLEQNRRAFKVLTKLQGSRKWPGILSANQLRSRAATFTDSARRTFGRTSGDTSALNTNGIATPTPAAESAAEALRQPRKQTFVTQLQTALVSAARKAQLSDINMPESSLAARRLAKEIFLTISKNGKTISPDDFFPFFKTQKDAYAAFGIFDEDRSGEISREEMRSTLQRIFEDRTMLNNSIQDMRSAFRNLDMVLLFIALIIIIFIWLVIFTGEQTISNLLPLSTIIVGFSFVFGNSAKNIFESMIFIFSTHPYDVGDLVCINDTWMYVTAFGMISTEFITVWNQVTITPNAVLAQSTIFNARRSASQYDIINVNVGFDTPVSKLDEFREKLTEFCAQNDKDWGGGLFLLYDSVRNMNCISLIIAVEHKGNWQDWLGRWLRRTKFMRYMRDLAQELGLTYNPPQQPISFIPDRANQWKPTMRYDNELLSTLQVPPSTQVPPSAMGQ